MMNVKGEARLAPERIKLLLAPLLQGSQASTKYTIAVIIAVITIHAN
jgi:hypothetical protein